MKRIVAPFLLASLPMSVNAAPDKYELQERCAKRAEQIFSKDWPHGSPDNSLGYTVTANYQSHCNPTLNKCFMLEISEAYQKDRPTLEKTLLEVNSNRQYGQFIGDLPFGKPSGLPLTCNLVKNSVGLKVNGTQWLTSIWKRTEQKICRK
jgi:hypothetical protein